MVYCCATIAGALPPLVFAYACAPCTSPSRQCVRSICRYGPLVSLGFLLIRSGLARFGLFYDKTTSPLKSILIGIGAVLVILAIIAGIKGGQIGFMIEQGKSFTQPLKPSPAPPPPYKPGRIYSEPLAL